MAAGDLTYTNHDGTVVSLNNGGTLFQQHRPRGWFHSTHEPVRLNTMLKVMDSVFMFNVMKPRTISTTLDVRGTPDAVLRHISDVIDVLRVDIVDDERGVLTYTDLNGLTRACKVVVDSIEPLTDWVHEFLGLPTRLYVPLTFIADDPSVYNPQSVIPTPTTFNGVNPVTQSCANAGNVDTYPRFLFTGVLVNPVVTDQNGDFWEVEITMVAGDTLEIDTDPLFPSIIYTPIATGVPVSRIMSLSVTSTPNLVVTPGTHNLTFTADATSVATIDTEFESRYFAHGKS